ncbi:hypothetical protein [Streptomyces sp. NPDC050428]|uniref:hypothetical protein n=1 Tax=Streptomyces sp. NPDC050428 TaxID=3155757 RepID=UPI0034277FCF
MERAEYTPFVVGETWGGCRVEAAIDLGGDRAEGLVHDEYGTPLQGLHPHSGTGSSGTICRWGNRRPCRRTSPDIRH